MNARRGVGILLIIIGIVALVWGGVFWTERDTIVDAGPLEISTENREGFGLPPVLGVIALVGGIILIALPSGRRG
jgi:uncharacterized membrane protein YidH (DUF202 family)